MFLVMISWHYSVYFLQRIFQQQLRDNSYTYQELRKAKNIYEEFWKELLELEEVYGDLRFGSLHEDYAKLFGSFYNPNPNIRKTKSEAIGFDNRF